MIIRRVALDLARARALDAQCPRVSPPDVPKAPRVTPVFVPKFLDPAQVAAIEAHYGPAKPGIRKIQNLDVSDWKNPDATRLGNRVTSFVPKSKGGTKVRFSVN